MIQINGFVHCLDRWNKGDIPINRNLLDYDGGRLLVKPIILPPAFVRVFVGKKFKLHSTLFHTRLVKPN